MLPDSRQGIVTFGGQYARPLDLTSATVTMARQQTGRRAEDLVAARLTAAGWRILDRNARFRSGEIDIVAVESRALVFVEVKAARSGLGPCPQSPELAVDPAKQRRLRRLAAAWLARRRPPSRWVELRFDVVGVTFGAGGITRYVHLRDAF